jgi:hypothetical protein
VVGLFEREVLLASGKPTGCPVVENTIAFFFEINSIPFGGNGTNKYVFLPLEFPPSLLRDTKFAWNITPFAYSLRFGK